jgi:catechol 2,3-dioxygenase-like lactoylglutathione lyase family enzyme
MLQRIEMRNKILLSLVILSSAFGLRAQSAAGFKYEPLFAAVIVNNVDSSTAWYQSVFDMKIKNRIDDTQNGFRVMIMESSTFLLELIENKSWPDQKKLLSGKPAGTRIQGFFKIGFTVPDMDACLKRLAALKIIPERIYTDADTKKRNFLINDPDGNLVQFFE